MNETRFSRVTTAMWRWLHHLGVSQSERIVWLCEELDLPYELIRYEWDPVTRLAPPGLKARLPLRAAPVLDDGPLRLAEFGAIVEYVIQKHGGGRLAVSPKSSNFADYLYWWHFANASLVPAAMIDGLAARLGSGDDPVTLSLRDRLNRDYRMVEARLGVVPFFVGDELTAADILMVFPLSTMRRFSNRRIDDLPNLRAYLERIGERPAYRRAMAKGDPGMVPLLD